MGLIWKRIRGEKSKASEPSADPGEEGGAEDSEGGKKKKKKMSAARKAQMKKNMKAVKEGLAEEVGKKKKKKKADTAARKGMAMPTGPIKFAEGQRAEWDAELKKCQKENAEAARTQGGKAASRTIRVCSLPTNCQNDAKTVKMDNMEILEFCAMPKGVDDFQSLDQVRYPLRSSSSS